MGNYNTVIAPVACPRCGTLVNAEIEVRFGDTSQFVTLNIGDKVPWVSADRKRTADAPRAETWMVTATWNVRAAERIRF